MEQPAPLKHSGLGIASFIISVVASVLMMMAFVIAGVVHQMRSGDNMKPLQAIVGLAMIFLFFLHLLAIGLGIGSLCQSGKKKLFGILGLCFSGCTVLLTIALMLIGARMMGKI